MKSARRAQHAPTMLRLVVSRSLRVASALILWSVAGCAIPAASLERKACPCTEGWTCDPATDRCVASSHGDVVRDAGGGDDDKGVGQDDGAIADAGACPEDLATAKDTDGDGVPDCRDQCSFDAAKTAAGMCGCGVVDKDSDSDGVADCVDECPANSSKSEAGMCGCLFSDSDDGDGDGTPDCSDECPSDPNKIAPLACGCGAADTDSDSDGVPNCVDLCANDPEKLDPGVCGCKVADTDGDGDEVPNCVDPCASDPKKVQPGACGCGVPDADDDMDGVLSCNEACPLDAQKVEPGHCGCGQSDGDSDEDGSADCDDACPNYPVSGAASHCACQAPLQACSVVPGVRRQHYIGSWERLPDFDTLTPDAEGVVTSIGLAEYDGGQEFGLLFTGYLSVSVAGRYDFELSSDDGSRLYIDGMLVVDLDAKHGVITRTGSLQLAPGLHPLRVEYFEAAGGEDLQLRYRLQDGAFAAVPASALAHAPQ